MEKFNSDVILFPDVAIANENERLQRQTQSTWWFILSYFRFHFALSRAQEWDLLHNYRL